MKARYLKSGNMVLFHYKGFHLGGIVKSNQKGRLVIMGLTGDYHFFLKKDQTIEELKIKKL